MPRYIAFLRAINVGGHTVKMDVLRSLFESIGFTDVETFIASGNVIFETKSKATTKLERDIERCLHKALGFEVATFLRTDSEVAAISQYRPFPDAMLKAAIALNIGFVSTPFDREAEATLKGLRTAIDEFHSNGREVYWLCRKRQSESGFSGAVFEKALGIRVTFRGINTVVKLAAKYSPLIAKSQD